MRPIPSEWKNIFKFSMAQFMTAQCLGVNVFSADNRLEFKVTEAPLKPPAIEPLRAEPNLRPASIGFFLEKYLDEKTHSRRKKVYTIPLMFGTLR